MALPPQTATAFQASKRPKEERQPAAKRCRVELRDGALHRPDVPQAAGRTSLTDATD